jgi:uncharacterized protein
MHQARSIVFLKAGNMSGLFKCTIVVILLLISCGEAPVSSPDVSGVWEGELNVAGMVLELKAVFTISDDSIAGTLDIPEQQARGLDLTDVILQGDSISFALPSNLGQGNFLGIVKSDTLMGSYEQGGYTGGFILIRTSGSPETPPMAGEEVTLTGVDCVIAGTLTLPDGDPPYPCVLLLSGSGLQDRDEYVLGFPVFAELASIFDSRGFAVLRCDDRGVGGSSGGMENFSDSVLLYDAGLMLDYLLGESRIDTQRIGILGHSEGSTIAFMLAAEHQDDIAFVISMAGPAVNGYTLIPSQLEVILASQGFDEEEIQGKLQAQYLIMDAVIENDVVLIDSILRAQTAAELAKLTDEQLASLDDPDVYLNEVVESSVASTLSPWFRNFIMHDPAEIIREVHVPVLCLLGELDTQVRPVTNIPPLEEALADNPDHSIVVIEGANHLFQEAVSGSVDEYAVLAPEFTPDFTSTLTTWLELR